MNEPPDSETIAEILYETYCEAVGGKAFNGDPLPKWQEFATDPNKTLQANGWRQVALQAKVELEP